jgi:enoyl-CoA hydratase/carnithine racemase
MKYQNVLLKLDGRIATITLNRPEKLNAINDGMLRDLMKALEKVRKD